MAAHRRAAMSTLSRIHSITGRLKKEPHGSGGRLDGDMIELLHGEVRQ